MTEVLHTIWTEEDGQDLIEYGLLLAIITVVAIIAIQSIGGKVAGYFNNADATLPAAK